MNEVILVNADDEEIGCKEKLQAHRDGDLHRAFSVLLYNSKNEMLIHKRALSKYHCPSLWTNACCSHPKPEETTLGAGHRRLNEELGYKEIALTKLFVFRYHAHFENGLQEHELDHVYRGLTDEDPPCCNPEEIEEYKWIGLEELESDMRNNPSHYTIWFREIMKRMKTEQHT